MKKNFFSLIIVSALLAGAGAVAYADPPATVEDEVKALSEAVVTLKARVKKTESGLATLKKSQQKEHRRLDRVEGEAGDASRTASKAVREIRELRSATMALREARGAQTSAPSSPSSHYGNLAEILRQAAEMSAAQARLLSEAGRLVDDPQ